MEPKFEREENPERKQVCDTENPFARSVLAYPIRSLLRVAMYVSPVAFLKSSLKYAGWYPDSFESISRVIFSLK